MSHLQFFCHIRTVTTTLMRSMFRGLERKSQEEVSIKEILDSDMPDADKLKATNKSLVTGNQGPGEEVDFFM